MPLILPEGLPVRDLLKRENVGLVGQHGQCGGVGRVFEIAIVNLMPLKEVTELQLLRLLGNTALTLKITLLHMESHISKNTGADHLSAFYNVFEEVRHRRFDGLIITGAPVETLPFEEVNYWQELTEVMEWSLENAGSVLHICWGAQAALYYHYGIPKYPLPGKMFGVFPHTRAADTSAADTSAAANIILRGFDDTFLVPHSRHTEIIREDIDKVPDLIVLSESKESGLYMVASADGKSQIYVTGHSEYDPLTLKSEYDRDIARGDKIAVPTNYFPDNDTTKSPTVLWRSHAHLLFSNWLNYCVAGTNSQ